MFEHLIAHTIGLFHLVTALAALLFGSAVIRSVKGTPRHRWIGRGYLASMVLLNVTALMIYDVFGRFGPFHWLALVSLASLFGGYLAVRVGWAGWEHSHAYFMVGSYIGLVAAAAAEIASRIPGWSFGTAVMISSGLIIAVGSGLMWLLVPRIISAHHSLPPNNGAG